MSLEQYKGNIRLVAIDVDDTLITPEITISPRVKAAIGQAQEKGVVVTLATGRMYSATLPFAQELGMELPLITYQGAYVKHSGTGELLLERPVPNLLARELIEFLREQELHINIYLDDKLYVEKLSREALDYANLARVPLHIVSDQLKTLGDQDSIKVLTVGDPKRLEELQGECEQRWGQYLYVTRSKPYYLEFMSREAGKGSAVAYLAEGLGINRQQVMAIGDSFNDLDLLEWAGLGVAMGNANETVKAKADWVTTSNREDGVACALETFVLGTN